MVEDKPPYHTIEDDPDLVRPDDRRKSRPPDCQEPSTGKGKGGTRRGFVAKNEIEDMTLFDAEPGKSPSPEDGEGSKSIDWKGTRKRK